MTAELKEKILGLKGMLERRGETLGLAESCTGGLLSSWLSQVPGISSFYIGAVVSYARQVKRDLLHVKESQILVLGEVSVPVAKAMAQGTRRSLQCDWAVAITGIAGPSGGTPEKPVGTVCFAVIGPGFEEALTHTFPSHLDRHEIQRQSALFAFDLLVSAII